MTRSRSRLALAPLVVAALALAACSSSPGTTVPTDEPTTSPTASEEPSETPAPAPSETSAPDVAWQTATAPDGATFEIPEGWTTQDATVEDEVGTVVGVDVIDPEGATVLSYWHDQGGLGGLGGACDSDPAFEVLGQWESPADYATMASNGATVIAAYAIEQSSGGVELSMGYTNDAQLAGPMCLTYNDFLAPDGLDASFANVFTSGIDVETDGTAFAEADDMWSFASFDEAQAFVDSDDGQTILHMLRSLEMPAA